MRAYDRERGSGPVSLAKSMGLLPSRLVTEVEALAASSLRIESRSSWRIAVISAVVPERFWWLGSAPAWRRTCATQVT
jgi:hypothetical protein